MCIINNIELEDIFSVVQIWTVVLSDQLIVSGVFGDLFRGASFSNLPGTTVSIIITMIVFENEILIFIHYKHYGTLSFKFISWFFPRFQ